jgi:predicted DNA-binding transcriptional regulator YafY
MPFNKHARIRYQTLDKCFRKTNKDYLIEDLIEACIKALEVAEYKDKGQKVSVSLRTIREDIAYMKSAEGWSISLNEHLKVGKKMIYRYEDPNYSINNQALNADEMEEIGDAMLLFRRMGGMPEFEFLQETVPRLMKAMGNEKNVDNVIGFGSNTDLQGLHYLGELFQYIIDKEVLKIVYKPFTSDTATVHIIHPYYLKEYNNRWFLFGLNNEYKSIQNMALDRIESITPRKLKYIKNTSIDFKTYFDDMVGVTKPKDSVAMKMVLLVAPITAKYILTKPFTNFKKPKANDGSRLQIANNIVDSWDTNRGTHSKEDWIELHSAMPLHINPELVSVILSFGNQVQVLEPEALKIELEKKRSITP